MVWSSLPHQGENLSLIYHSWLFMTALKAACMLISSHGSIMWDKSNVIFFMLCYTHFCFMMMSIVNGVCKGTSFLFAKLWASGPDEMTMWWLSARCCRFSHDFLMLFSHGSPPRNDKQMPNAFMDGIFHRSRSLTLQLFFLLSALSRRTPLCLLISLCLKPHLYLFPVPLIQPLSVSVSSSSCRYCAWSRLRWLWYCLRSRTPPLPLPLWL